MMHIEPGDSYFIVVADRRNFCDTFGKHIQEFLRFMREGYKLSSYFVCDHNFNEEDVQTPRKMHLRIRKCRPLVELFASFSRGYYKHHGMQVVFVSRKV